MTTHQTFYLDAADPSWQPHLNLALSKVDTAYLEKLTQSPDWLPGPEKIFNVFSLPVNQVNYVLFGESPYPRAQSANGFAFWDMAVKELWSPTGLSKAVNRATSLRNIIKMLLIADQQLHPGHTTQDDIARLNKTQFVQYNSELFTNFIQHGFLLLNASLVLQPTEVRKDAVAWYPFIQHILDFLFTERPHVQLILLGQIANTIDKLIAHYPIQKLYAEHPYNISFIENPAVIQFFKPLHLLTPINTQPFSVNGGPMLL